MAKIPKTQVDKALRDEVFNDLFNSPYKQDGFLEEYQKINDRQWGVILVDANDEKRYVRIGAIVAELREDMTAEELMASEIRKYEESVAKALEKKTKAEEKAKADKKKREEAKNNEA